MTRGNRRRAKREQRVSKRASTGGKKRSVKFRTYHRRRRGAALMPRLGAVQVRRPHPVHCQRIIYSTVRVQRRRGGAGGSGRHTNSHASPLPLNCVFCFCWDLCSSRTRRPTFHLLNGLSLSHTHQPVRHRIPSTGCAQLLGTIHTKGHPHVLQD